MAQRNSEMCMPGSGWVRYKTPKCSGLAVVFKKIGWKNILLEHTGQSRERLGKQW